MGCDIHIEVFAKVKPKGDMPDIIRIQPPPEWMWEDKKNLFDAQTSFPSWPTLRNYAAFGLLAGVRGETEPKYPPRGLPEFLSECCREVEYEGFTGASCKYYEFIWQQRISYTDFIDVTLDLGEHSRSWLTLKELKSINWEYKYFDDEEPGILWPGKILIPMLEKIAAYKDVKEVYVVFGFDS